MKLNDVYVILTSDENCFLDYEIYTDLEKLEVYVDNLNNTFKKKHKINIKDFKAYKIVTMAKAISLIKDEYYEMGQIDGPNDASY